MIVLHTRKIAGFVFLSSGKIEGVYSHYDKENCDKCITDCISFGFAFSIVCFAAV